MKRSLLSVALLMVGGMTGCVRVSDANDAATLGAGGGGIPMHHDARPAHLSPPSSETPDAASISGLDRAHWPESAWCVPGFEVEHQQLYTSHWVGAEWGGRSPRARGEYPRIENVEQLPTNFADRGQRVEALLLPLQAFGDGVSFPIRAVLTDPRTPARSPASRERLGPAR